MDPIAGPSSSSTSSSSSSEAAASAASASPSSSTNESTVNVAQEASSVERQASPLPSSAPSLPSTSSTTSNQPTPSTLSISSDDQTSNDLNTARPKPSAFNLAEARPAARVLIENQPESDTYVIPLRRSPSPEAFYRKPAQQFSGKLEAVTWIEADQLSQLIVEGTSPHSLLLVDSRSFLDYNYCHIQSAVNICCSKIVKRRLQQDKVTIRELLSNSFTGIQLGTPGQRVVVYDQDSTCVPFSGADSFLPVLLDKLTTVFDHVHLLYGGFKRFASSYRRHCTDKSQQPLKKKLASGALSQPCISNQGPTRILPFLYLGSQVDAMNRDVLMSHNITYELNVSTTCPKPDFIQDSHFLRISVNDNYSDKLLPHFPTAIRFLDKVRESSGCVLVHCLGGISRSATIAIAYLMRHMRMTSDDAYRYLKAKRATISPNFNFLGQLLEYEKQLIQERILEPNSSASLNQAKVGTPPIENVPGHTLSALSPHHHLLHHHFNPQPLHSPTSETLTASSSEPDTHPLSAALTTNRPSTSFASAATETASDGSISTLTHGSSEPMDSSNVGCDGQCTMSTDEGDEMPTASGHKRHCSLASGARKLTLNLPATEQIDSIGTIAFT